MAIKMHSRDRTKITRLKRQAEALPDFEVADLCQMALDGDEDSIAEALELANKKELAQWL